MTSAPIDLAHATKKSGGVFRRLHRRALSLRGASLDETDVSESTVTSFDIESSTLARCDFRRSWVNKAVFSAVTFRNCQFDGTLFEQAAFSGVTFRECRLPFVGLTGATLENVAFIGCSMQNIRLNDAHVDRCAFVNTDAALARLGGAIILASDLTGLCASRDIRFGDGVVVDWQSIALSARAINLEAFLIGTGMPELFAVSNANCARASSPDFLRMRSTFVSYGAPDAEFAMQVRDRLHESGVDVYIFAFDATPGERLSDLMYKAVNAYDRIIVICSQASLMRSGVRNEIREAFAREARDGGASYVIPIARDDYLFHSDDDLVRRLRDRVAADFRPKFDAQGRLQDDTSAMIGLLRALRVDQPGGA